MRFEISKEVLFVKGILLGPVRQVLQDDLVANPVVVGQHLPVFALEAAEWTSEGLRSGELGGQLVVEVAVGQVAEEGLAVQEGRVADRADDLAGSLLSLETGFDRFDWFWNWFAVVDGSKSLVLKLLC